MRSLRVRLFFSFVVMGSGFGSVGLAASASSTVEVLPTYRVEGVPETTMRQVADRFEVLRRLGKETFEVVVPQGREQELLALVPSAQVENEDLHKELRDLSKESGRYDLPSMERRLNNFAAQYPHLVKLEKYGTSREGRPEYVLSMGKDPSHLDTTKPGLMITSATHGDEVITVEVTLGLIDRLLKGYGQDDRLTRLVDNANIYWIPALCVDGYVHRSREVEGRDPNRDFAWPENPGRTPYTQCIQHAVQFFHGHPDIKGTMDFHAAASMIMFPWAYTYAEVPSADFRMFDDLTARMSEHNGFEHGQISKIIYVAKGSSADYYYWKGKTVSLGIEVSHNFVPAPGERPDDIVTENAESTWRFIEHFIPAP